MIRSKNEKEIEDACFCAGWLTPRPYTSYLNGRTVSLDAGSCFLTADSSETLRRATTKRTPLSEQRNTHLLTCSGHVRRASASSCSCDYSRTSGKRRSVSSPVGRIHACGKPCLSDTNQLIILFSINKTSLAELQQRSIFGFHDRRRRAEAVFSAYRVLENLSGQQAECG
jgi:hypothetical protein